MSARNLEHPDNRFRGTRDKSKLATPYVQVNSTIDTVRRDLRPRGSEAYDLSGRVEMHGGMLRCIPLGFQNNSALTFRADSRPNKRNRDKDGGNSPDADDIERPAPGRPLRHGVRKAGFGPAERG